MQQNSKCRLYEDEDEMINHIISECSKLVQKENETKHNWMEKVIHWELCKRLKFDLSTELCIHKPESNLEIEKPKIQWDFEIHTDHLILAKRLELVRNNKKSENFTIPVEWK